MPVDYSLYLVTGRELLPEGKTYLESLEESLRGGVTVVQVREKNSDTLEFLEIAQQTKDLCVKYGVPLIINDRIDIVLAVDADGVHLGQTDMPVHVARKLLPPGKILGVSCSNIEHVEKAVEDGVDYIGIGAVWGTNTKQLTSPILGVRGVGPILNALDGSPVKAVVIGGIKSGNILRTLHGSVSTSGHQLDGVAVVSDIVASLDPLASARALRQAFTAWSIGQAGTPNTYAVDSIKAGVVDLLRAIRESRPLVHQITNVVVTNQSANATLALGASPIMATASEEMYDLSRVLGALLINFGTVKDKEGMLLAGRYVNDAKKPVIFDPVGVGATHYRRTTAAELLNTWQASVIKGNAGELAALANSKEVQARGVDSVGAGFADPASFVRELAKRERCVVALTGVIDWVSDGTTVVKLQNGHPLLGDITGSGCMVGTCVATMCAGAYARASAEDASGKLVKGDMLLGAVAGILVPTIAAEYAAARSDVQGSGTFLPALIDELYNLTPEKVLEKARVQIV
ncbi:Hydroxyethylthiazole kinase family-domain-containing protein [Phlebopus sp. FC_14]|nr:Hydroxyethylthiazole kinase family-domain-containing protein [Phlebopus sp. FC_14]